MDFTKFNLILRSIIISMIYFFTNSLSHFDYILTSKVFTIVLVSYGIFLLCFIFIRSKIFAFINMLINCFFIVTFVIEILYYRSLMLQAPGEAGFAYIFIIPILAMLMFFAKWLWKDIKQFREINS